MEEKREMREGDQDFGEVKQIKNRGIFSRCGWSDRKREILGDR